MFCPNKKKISRTFKIRGALVFLCPKEGDERRETRDERRESERARDERRESERQVSKRIKVRWIIFLNDPDQNYKSSKF
jgi:hypothetical protein